MALGLSQPLREMSTRNLPGGVKDSSFLNYNFKHLIMTILLETCSEKLLKS
jgi:hypothetical protein